MTVSDTGELFVRDLAVYGRAALCNKLARAWAPVKSREPSGPYAVCSISSELLQHI